MKTENKSIATFGALALLALLTLNPQFSTAFAQGTAFTYQGRLYDGVNPANGTYEILFRPFGVLTGGSQLTIPNDRLVVVSNGLFTTTMDFGSAMFGGSPVFLQLEVRTNGTASFIVLAPRQQLTPTPYAIYASGAGASGITGTIPASALANAWLLNGNAGTSDDFIGTVDNTTFNIRVNNVRVMRYRLATDASGFSTNAPNVIGGSSVNSAPDTVVGATIAGGGGEYSPDGTAQANKVTADFGTVGGGEGNTASGDGATVSGGEFNIASHPDATVCGGAANTASSGDATVCGGIDNIASGNDATVCGGGNNIASGDSSFAAGSFAQAKHNGSFVWADASDFTFSSTTANQFRVRATGGVAFVTAIDGSGNVTAGVHLLAGDTAWSSISDKNAKKNFRPVDGKVILDKLAAIPVEKWNYKWEADTNPPHIGPMAQDFKGAFYPGRDDKSISTLEFDGVELAAIQGLNEKIEVRSQNAEVSIRKLEAENAELRQSVAELKAMVKQLVAQK